ncbi:MAG: ankyrin repeat domain-containing protein [Treponema sp.]|nr:ankyrin repeat domain-containing protein [Treponema sp.]
MEEVNDDRQNVDRRFMFLQYIEHSLEKTHGLVYTKSMKRFLFVVCCFYLMAPLFAEDDGLDDGIATDNDVDNNAALFRACMKGDVSQVHALLEAGADANAANNGVSVLMFAVNTGNVEIVKRLVFAGADVNYKNEAGVGALFLAAYSGDADMANALLVKDVRSGDAYIAAYIALLRENTDTAARLQEAAEYGKLDYRKLRRDEYTAGAHFRVYYTVSRIFVDKESVYRALCHLKETKDGEPADNYEFYIESKDRFPFIEGDVMEALVSYRALEHTEVSVAPYRAVEQAIFQIDKIIEIW